MATCEHFPETNRPVLSLTATCGDAEHFAEILCKQEVVGSIPSGSIL
jgi:hypothetical protein